MTCNRHFSVLPLDHPRITVPNFSGICAEAPDITVTVVVILGIKMKLGTRKVTVVYHTNQYPKVVMLIVSD